MLRRFRKRLEYDEVDLIFEDEHDELGSVESRFAPVPYHEERQAQHYVHASNVPNAPKDQPALTRPSHKRAVYINQQRSNDSAEQFEHNTGQSSYHESATQPQSNLLKAIHVQIVPPSTVDGRSKSRQRSREKLDSLSAKLREEHRQSPLHYAEHNRWGGKRTVDTPTASTRSSTRGSTERFGSIVTTDPRKSLIAKACGQIDVCQVANHACITPFVRPILRTVSTEESSILESQSLERVDSHNSAAGMVGSHSDVSSFVSGKSKKLLKRSEDENCSGMMRHAHAYNPTPPQRRSKLGGKSSTKASSALEENAKSYSIDRVISGDIEESAAVRDTNQADAEYITGRAYDKKVSAAAAAERATDSREQDDKFDSLCVYSVREHDNGDAGRDEKRFGAVELQLSTDNATNELSDPAACLRQGLSPSSIEKAYKADNHIDKEADQEAALAPAASAPAKQTVRKLPVILRAISPMRSPPRQDPSGTKQASKNTRGSALDANAQVDKNKQYPILEKQGTKPSLIRRAFTPKQRRSPSPRRPSPPAGRFSSSDQAVEPSVSQPMSKFRKSLRRSTSPPRDVPASEHTTQASPPCGIEPEPTNNVSEQPLSKIRRALTPTSRIFGRNGSATRQRGNGQAIEKESSQVASNRRGFDPPPDPPASPSWKVSGNYSPKSAKGKRKSKQSQLRKSETQSKTPQEPQHTSKRKDEQDKKPSEQQVSLNETSTPSPKEQTQTEPSQQKKMTTQLNSHQRRNYQQYVMMQKQKSQRLQSQQGLSKQSNTEPVVSQKLSKSGSKSRRMQQTDSQQVSGEQAFRYQTSEKIKSSQRMEQLQQSPTQPQPKSGDTQNLKTPVQMKKVLSSPSVMISTATSQTVNTTNTTTTSKFWDGVEGYRLTINPPDRNMSFETGLHGNPKKFDNITEEDFVILKKLNEKNKELQEFFQVRKVDENGQCQTLQSRTPPCSGMDAQLIAGSPTGSAMGSAFSLELPMNKHGYFDDSDISVLAMGDSATVYHMRATAETKQKSSSYWKEKYEKLKAETQRANPLRGMNEALLEEDEDSFLRSEKKKKPPRANARKDARVDDQSQLLQQQQFLLRCGSYMGGKKAKDAAQYYVPDVKKHEPKVEPKKTGKSLFGRAKCFLPDEEAELSLVEITPERPDQIQANCGGSSENGVGAKNIATRFLFPKLALDEREIQSKAPVATEVEVIANDLHCTSLVIDEEDPPDASDWRHIDHQNRQTPSEPVNNSGTDTPLGFESFNSDTMPLQSIGYVQRLETPSPHLIASGLIQEDATEGLACYNDPVYVMDDDDALKGWNKIRRPKALAAFQSLADELSADASRGKASSTDGSELSESARLIFEAALKHDIETLRSQRSRSAPRTPGKMLSTSPIQSPPHIVHKESDILSSFEVSGASVLSENFVSNIPQDFATWFELPSPGTHCIALIPMLKGHLRNSVVVELLSAFDGASNKIDAKGVHRISPRHRVNDVSQKSFAEYMESPMIVSKSSIDSEYMGPIIADGEDGSIRFADASIHLGGISDAATSHIKKREFQDAIDIYSTLLRSCQAMSGWLVEQLIASTLYNLSVLHLWNEEYDMALQYSRKCIRTKIENAGDNVLMMHTWANIGLIHYALEAHTYSVVAFRKAIDISAGISMDGDMSMTGRLLNNLGCVHAEIGSYEGALNDFEQSLRYQKDSASSSDADTSDAENLLSISMTIFNIGVTCSRQKHYHTAIKHTEASHAMQEALLGASSELADNTLFYLNLLRKVSSSSQSPDRNTPKHRHVREIPESSPSQAITRKDEVLDILDVNPESPQRRVKHAFSEGEEHFNAPIRNNDLSFPMLSFGSLKVEATTVERVRESLDRYDKSLKINTDRKRNSSIGRSLLCRKPPIGTKQPGIPSKLMSFGVKALRKLEVQTELNDNLERYGPRHPLVGQSHHSLGLVLLCVEKYEDSIDHFDKSIRINSHALGLKHPDVASSLMFMALAQFALERFDESAKSMLQVQHLRENESGKKHSEMYQIINNLACVKFELGELKHAESLMQEALDLQREIFFTEPEFLRGVSIVLFNIAFVHAKSGNFPKALIELEGALQIRQDILFEDATTVDITENMAYILAIHQLQNGSGNIDDITNEYINMLKKS